MNTNTYSLDADAPPLSPEILQVDVKYTFTCRDLEGRGWRYTGYFLRFEYINYSKGKVDNKLHRLLLCVFCSRSSNGGKNRGGKFICSVKPKDIKGLRYALRSEKCGAFLE